MPFLTNDPLPQCLQHNSATGGLLGRDHARGCRRYLLKVKCLPGRSRPGSDAMGRPARVSDHRRREQPMECPMPQCNDLSRSLVAFQQDNTLVAVVELSRSSWLVAGLVPGIGRNPLKKLDPSEEALLALLRRWRDEAARA